jgi:hypothetical protein
MGAPAVASDRMNQNLAACTITENGKRMQRKKTCEGVRVLLPTHSFGVQACLKQ